MIIQKILFLSYLLIQALDFLLISSAIVFLWTQEAFLLKRFGAYRSGIQRGDPHSLNDRSIKVSKAVRSMIWGQLVCWKYWQFPFLALLSEINSTYTIYIHHTWKKFNNNGQQKITLVCKAIFSFTFGNFTPFFAALRRFCPLKTATSCQVAAFFFQDWYIHICISYA